MAVRLPTPNARHVMGSFANKSSLVTDTCGRIDKVYLNRYTYSMSKKDGLDIIRKCILDEGVLAVHKNTGLSRGRLTDFVSGRSGLSSASISRLLSYFSLVVNAGSKKKLDSNLDKIVEFVLKYYSPTKITLFGSRARGDNRPDSDYDIFIEMPNYDGKIYVNKFKDGLDLPIDFIVSKNLKSNAQLEIEIKKDGVVLYEK
jgi:uncharacterized protein